ncbi:MAG: efflux transporter outer membrane subunit [Bacteroidaceae bacterium]|nr:efflux transporter outer membrane subunit [Prevotellaceae bacterium]MDY2849396.1 efflux transporter outer membrane subunit [Bacteroidaceae bacterium]
MKKSLYIIMSCTLLLSSCGIYKKYERPEVNTKGLYRDTLSDQDTLVSNDTTTLGSTPWREVFTDPKLQTLIDSALSNNSDLLTAALSVKQSEDMLKVAKLAYVPSFVFSPNGALSSWDGAKTNKTYSLPIQASWTVDLFGSLLNAKRAQQMVLVQARDYQRAVRTSIISGVANCYYTLLMLDEQLRITKETEALTEQTWKTMQDMKEYYGYNEGSVLSAKANYLSVKASIPEIERQIRETENSLSLLLAQAPTRIDRGTFAGQSLPENLRTGVGIQVLANRPDVHAKEMALANCFYNVNKARSAFYPNITITGSAAWTNSSGMGIVNPGKMLLNAVGSLVQPIFQHGQLIAGLRVAKSQQEQAYIAWQQSILNAGSEVSNALKLYETSAKLSEIEAERVETLQSNVEAVTALMANGSTYLEVITAQQALLASKLQKVVDDFNKMQAVVNLYYALGGGRD